MPSIVIIRTFTLCRWLHPPLIGIYRVGLFLVFGLCSTITTSLSIKSGRPFVYAHQYIVSVPELVLLCSTMAHPNIQYLYFLICYLPIRTEVNEHRDLCFSHW